MNSDNVIKIAQDGSVEDVANLLRSHGKLQWTAKVDGFTDCLDTITKSALADSNTARKARKMTLITAYTAEGVMALERHDIISDTATPLELKTLRQLAFNGASEKVADLLKAQANDEAAIQAIIEGVQQDRKRFGRRETWEDQERRSEKKEILAEFFAKSGRFAPVTPAEDRVAALEAQLAKMQELLADKAVEKPSEEKSAEEKPAEEKMAEKPVEEAAPGAPLKLRRSATSGGPL